jgi:hypothetical protein
VNRLLAGAVYAATMARALCLVLLAALAGCSAGSGRSSGSPNAPLAELTPADTPAPPRMGPDGPESPNVEDLVAYGDRHRETFGGLYIDPPGGQTVVMLFTADLETHAAAVNQILPGTRVRQVQFTEAALLALLESFDFEALRADGIEMVTAGLDTMGNRVTLEVKSDDPTLELRLETSHGGMLDVTVFPVPGEWANATEGDGWRLLEAGQASGAEAYTVRAATSEDEWASMWEAIGLPSLDAPAVDFDEVVAVSFGHGIGSSCPEVRLDGVDIEGGVVYSRTSDPLAPRGCTGDLAGAAVFVVAVHRDRLPRDGFTLRLGRELVTCADCGFSEEIDVPLP